MHGWENVKTANIINEANGKNCFFKTGKFIFYASQPMSFGFQTQT